MALMQLSSKALPIISDIHGNSKGLYQVLNRFSELGISRPPLVLGDLVWHEWADYDSSEVLDVLMAIPLFGIVSGNTDQWIVNGRLEEFEPKNDIDSTVKSNLMNWKQKCSPRYLAFIESLPEEFNFTYGDCNILALHASPMDSDIGIPPNLSLEEKERRLAEKSFDVLISGHLHQVFNQNLGNSTHFSVGAIGKHPYEYDGIMHYAILDETPNGIACYHGSIVQDKKPQRLITL